MSSVNTKITHIDQLIALSDSYAESDISKEDVSFRFATETSPHMCGAVLVDEEDIDDAIETYDRERSRNDKDARTCTITTLTPSLLDNFTVFMWRDGESLAVSVHKVHSLDARYIERLIDVSFGGLHLGRSNSLKIIIVDTRTKNILWRSRDKIEGIQSPKEMHDSIFGNEIHCDST